jgi:GT2 family glycosyltransferase
MPPVSQRGKHRGAGPEASVIVPVRNGERTLRRGLEAIFATRGVGEFEVIVVDDGSTDSTVAIASSFSCKVIRYGQGRGPAAARNTGAEAARAARLIFVDADVFVRPDTIGLLLSAMDSAPAAFATYDPEPLNRNFATLLYHTLSCLSLQDTGETTPVFYSYCAAIGKDLFLKMGGFDTSFTSATFEDMELGWQLAAQGLLSHHLKNARVDHAVQYTLLRLGRAYFRKSQDLALLLLSRRTVTFRDQGWTRRKHWVILACAWATLGLGPLAVLFHPLWTVPWVLAVGGFAVASAPLYRAMARRRWIYGPLSVLAYLGIHVIATAAMLSASLKFLGSLFRWRPSSWRQVRRADENLVSNSEGGRSL